jgi:hypothetical protein
METPTEVPKTNEDEKKVRKEYVMTEARQENLRKAREKAFRLRQELKDKKIPPPKPKSKMEKQLDELKDKYKDYVPTKTEKTEVINKDEPEQEPTTRSSDDKPMDQPITERTEQDVQQVEKPQPKNTTGKVKEKPIFDEPIEPIPKQEEPKIETQVVLPKPKIYKREGGFLYM